MVGILAAVIIIQRFVELYIAQKHYIRALKNRAEEFGREHYPLFFLLHGSWLVGWILEASLWGSITLASVFWLSVFILAQGLRYWCIISLGPSWNTRILVIPGQPKITKGPYRFMAHPNYIAVAFELVSVPLIFGAYLTAAIATLLNAGLILLIRLPAEEKALKLLENSK